jgi:PASTA domain
VSLSSANPKYSVVVLASNWTVVSIEPAPGTVVNANDPVVVKVYKD